MEKKTLKPIAEIMMTPLIDITMIFLLFFMIAYSQTSPQFFAQKVNIPDSSTALKLSEEKDTLEINIDAAGNIFLDNKPIEKKSLLEILTIKKQQGIKKILLRGDQNTSYQNIILAMDIIKKAGINHVLLLTKNKKEEEYKK